MSTLIYASSVLPPLHTTITSVTVMQACQSDLGITLSTGVSQWNDLTVNARHYTQGTAANQPSYSSTNLNGYPVLAFDGVNDRMDATGFLLSVPSTQNIYIAYVFRNNIWAANRTIIGSSRSGAVFCMYCNCAGVTPAVNQFNGGAGSNNNSAPTLGSWFLGEMFFSNSINDFIRIGATTITGTNTGNTNEAVGRAIGSGSGSAMVPAQVDLAFVMYCAGLPSAQNRTDLRNAIAAKYGGLVAT